ncbi:MAG TPA: DUF4157 domain-containing protein, partial [Ktedonobacterales bacterium]|nr:DUF4157 domain-containing protein [Ktedonobacterales bacterium]
TIHRAATGSGIEVGGQREERLRTRAGAGQPLPDDVRGAMESSLGFNFGAVRVHTDAEAARLNRDLNSRAFTYGADIYFNAGMYSPTSGAGRKLLAHELVHVAQQTGESRSESVARAMIQPMIQRDLNDDQKKAWADGGGEKIIAQVRSAVEAWKLFRQKPEKYGEMPRQTSAASDLAELLRTLGMLSVAYGQYAAEQLGAESVAYLTEMAAFMPEYRILVGAIPGVAYVPPAHKYTMTLKHEGATPDSVNPFISVEYTNAFNWHWTQTLVGMQAAWNVGISRDLKSGKVEGGMQDPAWGKKPGQENVLMPQIGLISINSNCVATPTGYWGYQDLGGPTLIANGPKLTGSFNGLGGKVMNTGGMISIMGLGGGPPGSLDFMNLEAKVINLQLKTPENKSELNTSDDPTDKFKVSLTLLEVAGGAVVTFGDASVSIASLQPTPVPEEKVWRYVYSGFETGSAEAPIPDGEVKSVLDLMKEDISDKQRNVESIKPYLEQAGIRQDFKLDFYCEGYASRRWLGAGTDDQARLQKNQELSERRAQNVTAMLNGAFGPGHTYSSTGKGAAIDLPQPGKRFGELIAEVGNEVLIEQLIRERAEQYQKDRADLSPDEARKAAEQDRKSIETNLGKTSDNAFARRVNITVTWSGYNIQWGASTSAPPAPSSASTPKKAE